MILLRGMRWLKRKYRAKFLPPGKYVSLTTRFAEIVDTRGKIARVARGFQFTEGPVWNSSRNSLLFSDIPASRIFEFKGPGEVTVFRENSNNSNGLTFDRQRRLIVCEHNTGSVTRLESDSSITVLANSYNGKRLNNPNDVTVKRDGSIYFTDPAWSAEKQSLPSAVYRINPDQRILQIVASDLVKPNGLAFSPDEHFLYVDDSGKRSIRKYEVRDDGTLTDGKIFCDMEIPVSGSPDGMKVDVDGHLYCTGPGGIWLLDPEGRHLGTIVIPEQPANCAWGDADLRSLYVTARTSIYKVRVKIPGVNVF